MADISYPQVVHDIKEKYIEATGAADNIKFGEIAQDVYDAITSGGGSDFPVAEYTFTSDFFDTSLKLFQDYIQQYMTKQNAYYYIKFEGNSTNDYYIRDMQTVWFISYGTTYFFRYENNDVVQYLISSAYSAYVKAGTVMKVYTLS